MDAIQSMLNHFVCKDWLQIQRQDGSIHNVFWNIALNDRVSNKVLFQEFFPLEESNELQ